jgi:2-oxoisovalerate dehydrogenase E1 component
MMAFDRKDLSDEDLLRFHRELLYPRMIEEKMLILLRQGRISKWFSGIGQEAISVGAALAMGRDEWIMPLHRNLGVFTVRGMPIEDLFLQWQGRKEGYSKGRERSFHFGSAEHRICGMISHLGPQLALADGAALAYRLRSEPKASLAFTGDGGTSEGDFHEALNVAAVWDLPVIFIIENNGYGLSTPVNEQYRCESLVQRAAGYGMEGVRIDGNNLLTVYDTVRGVREYCIREKKPYLIECMTFRMRGHEEASGTKYVPESLFDEWSARDPIANYERYLKETGLLGVEKMAAIREGFKALIDEGVKSGLESKPFVTDVDEELRDVYAPSTSSEPSANVSVKPSVGRFPKPGKPVDEDGVTLPEREEEMRFVDAIREGLGQSMEKHANLVLMGQDIAGYGGVFKITDGLMARFGSDRVRNTPLCESAILGAALGLSLEGFKSMVEMQFADFVSVGFNQIVNNLAKIHYRWGQKADVVIRMPTGAGVGAGPFHSQSNEAWFVHTPGLKVVYPSTPEDAKGLIIAAINDPNPVMYFEHKALYRSSTGPVPKGYYETEIGKARQVRQGTDLSIVTYGLGVNWAIEYADSHPEISMDILDLRTLLPFDKEAIRASVARSGKVIVLHEATLTGGMGAEIAAWIGEHCFRSLDAPVLRCASLDTPVPFALPLEAQFLAKSRLESVVRQLMSF